MDRRRAELVAAVVMWVLLVLLALASADKPPPPAFLLLAALLAAWCALIGWGMGTARNWGAGALALVGAGGAVATLIVLAVVKVGREGGPVPVEWLIGVVVVGVCGVAAALAQLGLARLLGRRRPRI